MAIVMGGVPGQHAELGLGLQSNELLIARGAMACCAFCLVPFQLE
jgi:hypothetical protein